MATKFLSAGTSETADLSMFSTSFTSNGALVSSTSNPNGQLRSLKATANAGGTSRAAEARLLPTAAGLGVANRMSFGIFIDHFADGYADGTTASDGISVFTNNGGTVCWQFTLDNNGNLRILDKNSASQATGSTVLLVNTFYRLTFTWNITDATHNTFKIFLSPAGGGAGVLEVTATNITIDTAVTQLFIGFQAWNSTTNAANLYITDIYLDDSNAATDVGNLHVTAKRPFADGTKVEWTTQIGVGGSGYGSGHTPQVNERALSTTNGWSIQNAATQTEEYTIEGAAVGDADISAATIVDYMGWADLKVGSASTGNLIVGGVGVNKSITTSFAIYTTFKGSTTYPAGSTDIGADTNAVNQLFSLAECGIMFAYIPATSGVTFIMNANLLQRFQQMDGPGDGIMRAGSRRRLN